MSARPNPRTRTLTAFGQDPSITINGEALTVSLEIPMERLAPGPWGARVHVIDFDATANALYKPVNCGDNDAYAKIKDPERLVRDPAFHAQNVFAIVMSTLARFEHALGRRASWAFPGGCGHAGCAPGRGHVIKVAPHAFADPNAFYSRRDEGILFGYFQGRAGPVFTCLAHDVIAHETTHALVDGLRPRYTDPSSPDQAAFQEGFADVVALLSVFRQKEVVAAALRTRGDRIATSHLTLECLRKYALLGLAEQMGDELAEARGNALRRSVELRPRPGLLDTDEFLEPHRRGEIFVAAMMNAFLDVWVTRLDGLGRKERPFVDRDRVIEEGAETADCLLTMAIRALDYAPPVDLQFSDYLSAVLTADREVDPDDAKYEYRRALLASFGAYGIEPVRDAAAPELGHWSPPPADVSLNCNHFESLQGNADEMYEFVWENRETLELHPEAYTYVPSVRPSTRIDADGFVLRETVAEYVQVLELQARDLKRLKIPVPKGMTASERVRLHGGGALLFDEYGRLKFHIGSGVASPKQGARLQYLWDAGFFNERRQAVRRFAELHRARAMGRSTTAAESW